MLDFCTKRHSSSTYERWKRLVRHELLFESCYRSQSVFDMETAWYSILCGRGRYIACNWSTAYGAWKHGWIPICHRLIWDMVGEVMVDAEYLDISQRIGTAYRYSRIEACRISTLILGAKLRNYAPNITSPCILL